MRKIFVSIPALLYIILSKIIKLMIRNSSLILNVITCITQNVNMDNSLVKQDLGY